MNTEKYLTWFIDYALWGSLMTWVFTFLSDGKLTMYRGAFVIFLIWNLTIVRDYFYKVFFSTNTISKFKKDAVISPDVVPYLLKLYAFLMTTVAGLVWLELVHFDLNIFTDPITTIITLLTEIWTMNVIKDIISMNWLHRLMHQKYYWLHKTHHKTLKDIQVINAFYFDLIDLVIEDVIGMGFCLTFNYLVFGRFQMHLASYLLLLIGETNIHSCNPYSIIYFFPPADYLFKSAIFHNLHHALNKDYYTAVAWTHVLPSEKQKDVEKYNQVFQTKISF